MLKKNRHAEYYLKFDLVVITNNAKPLLIGSVKKRLEEITKTILEDKWNCYLTQLKIENNYIQLSFEAMPQVQLSKFINNFKTVTSRYLRKEFTAFHHEEALWASSYFISISDEKSKQLALSYIEAKTKEKT